MQSGALPSKTLHRMVYNAILYSHKDTFAQGWTLWTVGGRSLRVTAFDDYFALSDQAQVRDFSGPDRSMMSLDMLKELEKSLRDLDEDFDLANLPLEPWDQGIGPELQDADGLCFPEGYLNPTPADFVALSPDRLRKLSLIKPGGYPIDFRVYDPPEGSDAERVIAFRCGPTVRGTMAAVSRSRLLELYSGEEVWRIQTPESTIGMK